MTMLMMRCGEEAGGGAGDWKGGGGGGAGWLAWVLGRGVPLTCAGSPVTTMACWLTTRCHVACLLQVHKEEAAVAGNEDCPSSSSGYAHVLLLLRLLRPLTHYSRYSHYSHTLMRHHA